jgi:hypothetical protein
MPGVTVTPKSKGSSLAHSVSLTTHILSSLLLLDGSGGFCPSSGITHYCPHGFDNGHSLPPNSTGATRSPSLNSPRTFQPFFVFAWGDNSRWGTLLISLLPHSSPVCGKDGFSVQQASTVAQFGQLSVCWNSRCSVGAERCGWDGRKHFGNFCHRCTWERGQ